MFCASVISVDVQERTQVPSQVKVNTASDKRVAELAAVALNSTVKEVDVIPSKGVADAETEVVLDPKELFEIALQGNDYRFTEKLLQGNPGLISATQATALLWQKVCYCSRYELSELPQWIHLMGSQGALVSKELLELFRKRWDLDLGTFAISAVRIDSKFLQDFQKTHSALQTYQGTNPSLSIETNAKASFELLRLIETDRALSLFHVQTLLDQGADVSAVNEKGETSLALAIRRGSFLTAHFLVERGADLNQRTHISGQEHIPVLTAAIEFPNLDAFKFLKNKDPQFFERFNPSFKETLMEYMIRRRKEMPDLYKWVEYLYSQGCPVSRRAYKFLVTVPMPHGLWCLELLENIRKQLAASDETVSSPKDNSPWEKTPFQITPETALAFLGLSVSCTEEDVRKKYRELAIELHPDKCIKQSKETDESFLKRQKTSEEKFKYLNASYRCLIKR